MGVKILSTSQFGPVRLFVVFKTLEGDVSRSANLQPMQGFSNAAHYVRVGESTEVSNQILRDAVLLFPTEVHMVAAQPLA
jgi:hypothetical protein